MRLDIELVRRNLFRSRTSSQEAIRNGIVFCDGKMIKKSSFEVSEMTNIEIKGETLKYVSRAGLKLEGAIYAFNLHFDNKIMLDIGSSTGGFTDCALQHNVKRVIAVDVGSDVMDNALRGNPKIELHEQTDIRDIESERLKDVQLTTIDVSFISVLKILESIKDLPNLNEIVCLIKPQFECGKQLADKYKGVVLNKTVHKEVIDSVIKGFSCIGFNCQGVEPSCIRGGSGNIEYVSYFVKTLPPKLVFVQKVIDKAFMNI